MSRVGGGVASSSLARTRIPNVPPPHPCFTYILPRPVSVSLEESLVMSRRELLHCTLECDHLIIVRHAFFFFHFFPDEGCPRRKVFSHSMVLVRAVDAIIIILRRVLPLAERPLRWTRNRMYSPECVVPLQVESGTGHSHSSRVQILPSQSCLVIG